MNTSTTTTTDYTQLTGDARREAFLALIAASPAATELMSRLTKQAADVIAANPWRGQTGYWADAMMSTLCCHYQLVADGRLTVEQELLCDEILAPLDSAVISAPRAASESGIELLRTLLIAGTIDVLALAAAQQELELA
ncbi:hypothetical protein [Duganella caerulea]|uniref:hypothetical protein n=1 Tax=Duganella caerulea TaxID=2885762 RepID=UPI00403789AD